MVIILNGKELKVVEYDLKFGQKPRMVNVFGVFKYRPNNNLYVIYADVDTTYSYVSYGSSHVKNDSVLSMSCNKDKDEEIIKEYIFKVTKKEKLDDFEMISLDNITDIEIISSNNLEIKKEVMNKLVDLTIPKKKEEKKEVKKTSKKKSRFGCKILIFLFLILLVAGAFYFYTKPKGNDNDVAKNIVCTKTYAHEELEGVSVDEEKTFNFNNSDSLLEVDAVTLYRFDSEENYLNFINKALYYKYMPDGSDTTGGWTPDDEAHTFKMIEKIEVDEGYDDSTNYEEVLAVSRKDGYTCNENIEK